MGDRSADRRSVAEVYLEHLTARAAVEFERRQAGLNAVCAVD